MERFAIENSQFCATLENLSPIQAASGGAVAFSFDVAATGTGVIDSVTVTSWGDASGGDAATAGTAPEYTASHTYAAAGTYIITFKVVLVTGEEIVFERHVEIS